jgi:hypothetical protein
MRCQPPRNKIEALIHSGSIAKDLIDPLLGLSTYWAVMSDFGRTMRIRSCFRQIGMFVTLASIVASASARPVAIRAARWLDVDSGRTQSPATVVVDGGRIASVNPDQLPANSDIIDLGDATLLPGLMDMHIHLMDEPGADWIRQRAYETQATWALRAARNA